MKFIKCDAVVGLKDEVRLSDLNKAIYQNHDFGFSFELIIFII